MIPHLCRTCGKWWEASGSVAARTCPDCGSARVVRHEELGALTIAHVDCDAFFASIEKRDRPELSHLPVLVGGGRHGVVSTCCYIARTYGIHSAMPMFEALKRCPDAVVVRSRFDAYRDAAIQIREEMMALTPLVQPVSIDEAYMDLSGTERLHGEPPAATLARFARAVEKRVGVTVSIGLAPNKLLAKIASDLDKPEGFAVIGRAEAASFLAPRPPSTLPGVGARFAAKLMRDGFATLGDLAVREEGDLMARYGEHGLKLAARARGEDDRPVKVERETKSISGETTFGDGISDREGLEDRLYAMAKKTAARAKEKGLAGRVVTLKLKTAKFRSFTRRTTLPHATNLRGTIYETGRALLAEEMARRPKERYRLIGIGISDLVEARLMGDGYLFADDHRRLGAREDALDSLQKRFGEGAVGTLRDRRTQKPDTPKPDKDDRP